MRADDVEALALALSDNDIVLIDGARSEALADAVEERARFSMRRLIICFLLATLHRKGTRLERDANMPSVRRAWLVDAHPMA